jgi:hypothetical protein
MRPPVVAVPLPLLLLLLPAPVGANFKTLLTRYTAAPSPLVVEDRLFIYATHDRDDANDYRNSTEDYNVFSTADAVNWRDDGIAFSPIHNTTWAKSVGAQQTIWHQPLQKYLMYFSGRQGDGAAVSVGVAAASDPRGPFVDYAAGPIAQGEDPTILMDDDSGGVGTILCTSFGLSGAGKVPWCGLLSPDMQSLVRNQTRVNIEGLGQGQFYGAPWLFKRQGTYYLSFMTSHDCACGGPFGYGIGYATNNSTDPFGNYTYRGPLMWPNPKNCAKTSNVTLNAQLCANNARLSPGGNVHHGIALDWPKGSNQHWVAYHTRILVVEKGEVTFSQRNVGLDRMYFDAIREGQPTGSDASNSAPEEGPPPAAGGAAIFPVTSTPDWVRQQRFVDPHAVQPAATMAAAADGNGSSLFFSTEPGAVIDPEGGMWRTLTNISANDTVRINGVDLDIFTSQDLDWDKKNITARLSCNQDVTVEVRVAAGKGTPRWGDWAAEPVWPTPGQPAMSTAVTEVPHARLNVSASSKFTNVSAMMSAGSKPYGVSHQMGACEAGCPPSTLDLLFTFRSASYVPPGPPPPPLLWYTCFGLGIKDCDPRAHQNLTLCFCMKPVGEHGCDPRYHQGPGPGGHGCFPSQTCGGVCPKGHAAALAAAAAAVSGTANSQVPADDGSASLKCSMSSWVFGRPDPTRPQPRVSSPQAPAAPTRKPDPVATHVALRSRATGKYVAAMTANRQGMGEVTAAWCHVSIETAFALSQSDDGAYSFNTMGSDGALARCDKTNQDQCSSGTDGGVGISGRADDGREHRYPQLNWRLIGTPDGGVIVQAAEAALSWPPTGLLLAPTGEEPTTYDGQLLFTGDYRQITAGSNSSQQVSRGCAAVLQDRCLPWLGEPTITCAKHCSMGQPDMRAGALDSDAHKEKPGCNLNRGLPKSYRQVCAEATSPAACLRFNATCHWVEPPALPPPEGCTAAEVQGWCGGGQAVVWDVCKLTVVGQTLIDCGGCRPCCGENGPPGDCNADQSCPDLAAVAK